MQDTLELEQQLIVTLVNYPETIGRAVEIIGNKPVFRPELAAAYLTIVKLWEKRDYIDFATVRASMTEYRKHFDGLIEHVQAAAPSAVDTYAMLLVEAYIKRTIGEIGRELSGNSQKLEQDAHELLDLAESKIFRVSTSLLRRDFVSVGEAIRHALSKLAKAQKDGFGGIPSGFKSLDDILGGFHASELTVIAGRPSVGKTAFALDILDSISTKGIPCGLVSLEMGAVQLVNRIIAKHTGISSHRIRMGFLTPVENQIVQETSAKIASSPLFIEDSGSISVGELKAKCRRLVLEHKVKLIAIDYLQLLSGGRGKDGTREQEVSYMSRSLKALAKELDIPVIALSQLSRNVEYRGDKKPQLSDLRESGAIEQDADVVVFIWTKSDNADELRNVMVAKQRNGPLGDVTVEYVRDRNTFKEVDDDGRFIKDIEDVYMG